MRKKIILIILSLFLTTNMILTSGCLTSDNRNITPDSTNAAQTPDDFEVKILEYYDHVYNESSVLSMNYSEIVEENYTDIPTLIDTESNDTASYCNFSMNLSFCASCL